MKQVFYILLVLFIIWAVFGIWVTGKADKVYRQNLDNLNKARAEGKELDTIIYNPYANWARIWRIPFAHKTQFMQS